MSKGNRLPDNQKQYAAYTEREVFPLRLRDLMQKHEIRQEDLAEGIGVSRVTVGRYCNGTHTPDIKTAYMIADYFNVSVGYLLGENGYETPAEFREYCRRHNGEPICKLINMLLELNEKGFDKAMERVEELHSNPHYSKAAYFREQERNIEYLNNLLAERFGISPRIGQSFEDALTEYLLNQPR